MKASELRELSEQALHDELMSLLREQFNLRMQKGSGQLVKPHLFKKVRRSIARVKTMLHNKMIHKKVDDKS